MQIKDYSDSRHNIFKACFHVLNQLDFSIYESSFRNGIILASKGGKPSAFPHNMEIKVKLHDTLKVEVSVVSASDSIEKVSSDINVTIEKSFLDMLDESLK